MYLTLRKPNPRSHLRSLHDLFLEQDVWKVQLSRSLVVWLLASIIDTGFDTHRLGWIQTWKKGGEVRFLV